MGTLSTALRGLGRGVMALLAGIWSVVVWEARRWDPRRSRRAQATKGLRGWWFLFFMAALLGMAVVSMGLSEWLRVLAIVATGVILTPVLAYMRDFRVLQRVAKCSKERLAIRRTISVAVVAAILSCSILTVDPAFAHPPNAENGADDTVPHPQAGKTILPGDAAEWIAAVLGEGEAFACGVLVAAGYAYSGANPASLPAAAVIGVSCWIGAQFLEIETTKLLKAVQYPLVVHPEPIKETGASLNCAGALSVGGTGILTPTLVRQCAVQEHLATHETFEQGPAKHAAERASILADAQKKLAAKVAVYQEYTGERLSQRGGPRSF